jgi:hypothetical protein
MIAPSPFISSPAINGTPEESLNGDKYVNPSTYLASTFITCPVTGRMDARRTARELSLKIGTFKKSKLYLNPLKVNSNLT